MLARSQLSRFFFNFIEKNNVRYMCELHRHGHSTSLYNSYGLHPSDGRQFLVSEQLDTIVLTHDRLLRFC